MPRLKLTGKVGIDSRGWQKGLGDIKRSAGAFGKDIKGIFIGAFAAGAILKGLRDTVAFGSRISDLATKFKITAKELQNVDFAAKKAGTSLEVVGRAINTLAISRLEALTNPGGTKGLIFKALGITQEELRNLSDFDLLFRRIGPLFATTDFGGQTQGLLGQLIGSKTTDLLTAFREDLSKGIDLADKLGIALDDGVIQKLDDMADLWEQMTAEMRGPFSKVILFISGLINGWLIAFKTLVKLIGIGGRMFGAGRVGSFRSTELAIEGDVEAKKGLRKSINQFRSAFGVDALPEIDDEGNEIKPKPGFTKKVDIDLKRLMEKGRTQEGRVRLQAELNQLEFNELTMKVKLSELLKEQVAATIDLRAAEALGLDTLVQTIALKKAEAAANAARVQVDAAEEAAAKETLKGVTATSTALTTKPITKAARVMRSRRWGDLPNAPV